MGNIEIYTFILMIVIVPTAISIVGYLRSQANTLEDIRRLLEEEANEERFPVTKTTY